jgi:hypothetical protein
MSVTGNMYVTTISAIDTEITLSGSVFVVTTLDVKSLSTDEALLLAKQSAAVTRDGYVGFYVDSTDSHLYYSHELEPGHTIRTEITDTLTGALETYVPLFHNNYGLAPTKDFFIRETTAYGDSLFQARLPVSVNVANLISTVDFNHTAQKMELRFDNRADAIAGIYYGLVVSGSAETGYLDDRDTLVGLSVDARGISSNTSETVEGEVFATEGYIYPALLSGAQVGITAEGGMFHPSASLHVSGNADQGAFFVADALSVSKNGFVGVGHVTTNAYLSIVDSQDELFRVGLNSDEASILFDVDQGVSFGKASSFSGADVAGDVSASAMYGGVLESESLQIGGGSGLYVNSDKTVGVGLSTPEAQFHMQSQLLGLDTDFRQLVISYNVESNVAHSLSGVSIVATQNVDNILGSDTAVTRITAFSVNALDDFVMATDSRLDGVYIKTKPSIPAAVFKGGYLGFGTEVTAYTADVAGTLQGDNFVNESESVSFSADSVTLNSLFVYENGLASSSTFIVENADPVSINHLIFREQDANFDVVAF